MIITMKSFINTSIICVHIVMVGFMVVSPCSSVEAASKSDWISVPPAATAPLGELVTDNPALFDVISGSAHTGTSSSNGGLTTKVAPGESLPIAVKLSNFGGGQKVDVLITYSIFSNTGNKIYSTSDTVAVETTADFIKIAQIPTDASPGTYTAQTSIVYPGQVTPATSQFSFTVERKILGIFQSDVVFYGGLTILVCLVSVSVGHIFVKRRRAVRLTPFDYSSIPHDQRTFYEILSDTIMEMRQRVGDDALLIATKIDGLSVDEKTGRVLLITEHPSKVIATLVAKYEELLGKKVSFSFRRQGKPI